MFFLGFLDVFLVFWFVEKKHPPKKSVDLKFLGFLLGVFLF